MSRSPLHRALSRIAGIAAYCDRNDLPTAEGIERIEAEHERRRIARREFLATAGLAVAAGAVSALSPSAVRALGRRGSTGPDVGIVGAGLAGLVCAVELQEGGIGATVYDAADRVGGRVHSLRGFFPGQVAERGGEFIDTLHTTMLGYARSFGLELENVETLPGDVVYYFDGQRYGEAAVVEEFRAFVSTMRADLRAISGEITAGSHTAADIALDRTSLAEYLDGRNATGTIAGPVVREAIRQAYIAEYGLEIEQQSCLNFLLFVHADRRSKFKPFGVYSDERYHIVDGNDRITSGLAGLLDRDVELGLRLVAVRRTSTGRIELTMRDGSRTITRTHDTVVLAVPFSVLRGVELDASLAIPTAQREAIRTLGYGMNAKMMVGFSSRPWRAIDGNGTAYADLPNVQTVWESNPVNATGSRAILTDYSGGVRGLRLDPNRAQLETSRFLADLDRVFPRAAAAATRSAGAYRTHLEHWPSNPLTRGSYTCYTPGQFTTIAGIEGRSVGNLHFAGEHTNSFYEWQGFMEGAALSGIAAASVIAATTRSARVD
ncbi:MAG TPA: FAD-dependent oxidoreductase [Candidatus Kapabacteria bacterium]|nr:FAD-dependent oxidoreductase [Candidatus Kapabacteria bacterium]